MSLQWLWTAHGVPIPSPRAHNALVLLLLFSLFVDTTGTRAEPTNRTIDDEWGDSVTGIRPVYSANWNYGPGCTVCNVVPSQSMAFGGTWHDTTSTIPDTDEHYVTLSFAGNWQGHCLIRRELT